MSDLPPSRAELRIDLDAIGHNVGLLAGRAARSGAKTMAIVKADGYGHGAVDVARTALRSGAEWIGVASVSEALELRDAGIEAPLLCWLYVYGEDLTPAVEAAVDVSVSTLSQLRSVVAAADSLGRTARIHLKIDTGLHRNGCPQELWPELVEAAARAEADGSVSVYAVWSHLACADEPGHPSVDTQAQRFRSAHQRAQRAGLSPLRHLANSAALLTRTDLHFDMVRPGIAIYGQDPVPEQGDHELRPAMTFRSSVALRKRIPAGEGVSYGMTWIAPYDMNLALVPVGYADGVPRALSGRMSVWLRGKRRSVVGRVCMDQIVVACDGDTIEEGDEVILFGSGERGEPTAAEWARELGTIHYEIVAGMYRPRVRRTTVQTEVDA